MKNSDWGDFYENRISLETFLADLNVHRDLLEMILEERPRRVLEIGIGTGSMSTFFSYLGIESFGIDNNSSVLEGAEKFAKSLRGGVTFQNADAFSLPFDADYFDVVFSQGLMEHFSDEKIAELIKESLRVGKAVVFSVPNNFYPTKDFGDERLMTKNEWDKLLKKSFTLVASKNYHEISWSGEGFIKKAQNYILKKYLGRKNRPVMYLAKVRRW